SSASRTSSKSPMTCLCCVFRKSVAFMGVPPRGRPKQDRCRPRGDRTQVSRWAVVGIRQHTATEPSPLRRVNGRHPPCCPGPGEWHMVMAHEGGAVTGEAGDIPRLIAEATRARARLLERIRPLSPAQGVFQPDPGEWSIAENVEHLVLAEQGSINRVWAAADGRRRGHPPWTGEAVHRGKSIEQIVADTWA